MSRAQTRASSRKSSAVRWALGAGVAALGLFHLRLLWSRLTDATMFEPVVAVKWFAAALLLASLWWMRARGHKLFGGRRAAILWLIAVLLHVQLPAPLASPLADGAESAGWLLALPVGVSLGVGLAHGLARLLSGAFAAAAPPRATRGPRLLSRLRPLVGALPALYSRPPPLPA